MKQHNYFTYIITNYKKRVLYTGVTNDIENRLYEHYFGINQENSFTSKYKCFYLLWYERHQYINHAIEREKEIKGWTRAKKINLIEQENPMWTFLNKEIMEWPPIKHHTEQGGALIGD
jgi:putative endonuclease